MVHSLSGIAPDQLPAGKEPFLPNLTVFVLAIDRVFHSGAVKAGTDCSIQKFFHFTSSLSFLASQAELLPGTENFCAAAQAPAPGNSALHIGLWGIYPYKHGPPPKGKGLTPHMFRLL